MKPRRLTSLALAAAATLTAGCGSRTLVLDDGGRGGGGGIGVGGTGGTGTDGGRFTPSRNVDILFMIDNSSEVRINQTALIAGFPTFMTALAGAPAGLPDLHLAVITSDLGAGDGSIAGCDATGGNQGIFKYTARGTCTNTNLQPGATYISNVAGVANYTGNLADVFACIAALGESGCGFEHQLAAISRALGADGMPAPPENQGFLRDDAFLLIVVLTNEDDCSAPPGSGLFDTKTNTKLASPLGPAANYRCNEFGHLCNGAKPPRYAPTGSVSDTVTLDGCVSAESAGMLTPVGTMVSQLRALKPYPDQQIVVAAIAGPATPYVVHWHMPSIADPGGPWP